MDDSVKKVPGCDKFTRPEEINALSKYLKQKRIDLENQTTLQEDTLGIPGYTDHGSLKDDFEKLPESIDPNSQAIPDVESDRIKELNDIREKLSGDPKNNIPLNNSRSDLKKPEDINLDNSRLDLKKPEDPRLDNRVEKIKKHSEPKLDNRVEKIKKHSEPKLDDSIEKIEPKSNPELTDTVEKIKDSSTDNLKLREEKISLKDTQSEKINLETTSEHLEVDNSKLSLDNTVSGITEQEKVDSLDSSVLGLSGEQKEPSLSNTVVDLKNASEKSNKLDESKFSLPGEQKKQDLSGVKKPLPGERKELSLTDYLDTLGIDNSEVSLDKDVSELFPGDKNIQLNSKVAKLKPGKEKISLDKDIEKLKLNEKELSLSKSPETLVLPKSDPPLVQSSEKLKIPETEINLTQKRESVPGERKDIENFNNSVVDIIGDTDKVEFLSDQKETITDTRKDIKLDNTRSDISVNPDSSLDTTREDLSGTQKPVGLNNSRANIRVKDDPILDDSISRITGVKDVNLDNTVETIETSQDNELDDSVYSRPGKDKEIILQDGAVGIINNDQNKTLSDNGSEVVDLDKTIESRPGYKPHSGSQSPLIDSSTGEISDDLLKEVDEILKSRKDLNLYYTNILHFADSKKLDKGWASKVKSLMSAYLSGDTKNIDYVKAQNFENALYGSIINVSDFSDTDTELPENTNNDLDSRIEATIGDRNFKKNDTWIPRYKLDRLNKFDSSTPLRTLNSLDTDIKSLVGAPEKYIRWAAETTLGMDKNHKLDRESLLDETLKVLVKYRRKLEVISKLSRDRLPGNDTNQFAKAAQEGKGSITSIISTLGKNLKSGFDEWRSGKRLGVDTSQIHNRPNIVDTGTGEGEVRTISFERANRRPDALDTYDADKHDTDTKQKGTIKGLFKKNNITRLLKSAVTGHYLDSDLSANNYNFFDNYIGPYLGIGTTLEELAGTKIEDLKDRSVEELQDVLKNSDYITTFNKYTSGPGGYKTTTLDSNNYWELIFEPFVGIENGGFSYLPRIEEINAWNLINFGVSTGYSRWIPFISFELQKSRLNSKTVGLYQGEISYPVSMEFTNEFRVSIVDDQYKSWRTYFERCVDASIYNSEVHNSEFYGYKTDIYGLPTKWEGPDKVDSSYDFLYLTPIDKKFTCVSLYKNVTFRCKIYNLTPQLSTISKYDLLLVLKDFSEERSGDISGGGNELNLSFSIVGENPREIKSPLNNVSSLTSVYESSYNHNYSDTYKNTEEYKNWLKEENKGKAYDDWQNKEKDAEKAKTTWNEKKSIAKKNKDKSKQAKLDKEAKDAEADYNSKKAAEDAAKKKYDDLNKTTTTKTQTKSTRTKKKTNKKNSSKKKTNKKKNKLCM